jgi:alpha-N-arabinofuranosidase
MEAITARAVVHPSFVIGPVPRRLFGSFVEHMGRCVYGGLYEPGHARADASGFRTDVLDLVKELGVTTVRYPGGNYVSSYRWEDSVGPVEHRSPSLDLAWRSVEANAFGLNEFMEWSRMAGVEPMMAVNLGTRGIQEACDLLEYANFPGGTKYSDLRVEHGAKEPHGIRMWCLGNEMDGEWQIGHKTASEYGRIAAECARALRRIDPTVELVACGSSNERMATFGSWEGTVLDETYDLVDFISLHAYFEDRGQGRAAFLASSRVMDSFIESVVSTCDHVKSKKRSKRVMRLSFDEWNVWHESRFVGQQQLEWSEAPRLIEDTYTAEDAVVVGSLLMSLLRHADRVEAASMAQLVNVIAPIRAESEGEAWRQTIFYPFALTARHARGEVLHVQVDGPLIACGEVGEAPAVEVVATHDASSGEVTIFAFNRHERDDVWLDVRLCDLTGLVVQEHVVMGGDDLDAVNTQEAPGRVVPRLSSAHQLHDEILGMRLSPVSWSMLRLGPASQGAPGQGRKEA